MKRCFFMVLFWSIMLAWPGLAQTKVQGDQSGVWHQQGSPYYVIGDVRIPAGQTLKITAGVKVIFQGNYHFTVNGKLEALGTRQEPIQFTSTDHENGWHGIRIRDSEAESYLNFCHIRYGHAEGVYPDNLGGGVLVYNASATIRNCCFCHNRSALHGGALYSINAPKLQVINCNFRNNHCYMWGGAINIANSYVQIQGCVFQDNTTDYSGAAIYCDNVYHPLIVGCAFVGNTARLSSGGAICANYSTPFFTNCTFTRNTTASACSRGPALYLTYSEAILTNCILYANKGSGDELHIDVGASAKAFYCNLSIPNSPNFTGAHNVTSDPVFVNAQAGDVHLTAQSPCIDAGVAFWQVEDIHGQTITTVDLKPGQYSGAAPDMGCLEFAHQ